LRCAGGERRAQKQQESRRVRCKAESGMGFAPGMDGTTRSGPTVHKPSIRWPRTKAIRRAENSGKSDAPILTRALAIRWEGREGFCRTGSSLGVLYTEQREPRGPRRRSAPREFSALPASFETQ
jgi:hypothetical protein